jgi:hypothetical protein
MVVVLLATAVLGYVVGKDLTRHSNLLAAETPEAQLYDWARTTGKDSVFLIPPDLDGFRLSSRRAVVVDWKSTPFAGTQLEEWYRRIDAVSGMTHPRTPAQAVAGYAGLSGSRLADLAETYGASYVVLREPTRQPPPAWQTVFANGRYAVFRTGVVP